MTNENATLLTPEQYEQLLTKNERRLWRITEQYEKLSMFVKKILWPRASMTVPKEARDEMVSSLAALGVDVEGGNHG